MSLKHWIGIVVLGGWCAAGCEELGVPATNQAATASSEPQGRSGQTHSTHDAPTLTDAGSVTIGTLDVRLLRGSAAAAGQPLRLVIQIPDDTATASVRGWIGTDGRFDSAVTEAAYSEQLGGYELRATAPDPLPAKAVWWIEVQRVGGATHVGSVPLR